MRAASLQGRFLRGVVHVFRGEFATAIDLIEQCHDLREPAYRNASLAISAEDWYSLMLGYSAVALVCLGYFEQAELRCPSEPLGGTQSSTRFQHHVLFGIDVLVHVCGEHAQ